MYCPRLVLSFITRKVVRKELLQEMGEFDWLRKHVLQIVITRVGGPKWIIKISAIPLVEND